MSALLIHLLEVGAIDAALLTDFSRREGTLSIGSARIARDREDILALAGSKYLFSPVLSLLREAGEDATIKRVALVCLPCHAHAFRKMEADPRTKSLTRKVSLVIGLNCGAVNLDEGKWKTVVGRMTGLEPGLISNVDIRKISSSILMVKAGSTDGRKVEKAVPFSTYSTSVLRIGVWERCRLCVDYSCYLSDITFGSPITRTQRGTQAIDSAVRAGVLVRSSFKRRAVQRILDSLWGTWKPFRARREISRRKKKGLPAPIYR